MNMKKRLTRGNGVAERIISERAGTGGEMYFTPTAAARAHEHQRQKDLNVTES